MYKNNQLFSYLKSITLSGVVSVSLFSVGVLSSSEVYANKVWPGKSKIPAEYIVSGPKTIKTINAVIATGLNRQFGEPIMDLGTLGDYGYDTVAIHNSGGNTPLPFTAETGMNELVSTIIDPEFLSSHGLKSLNEIDAEFINVPLRQVKMNGSFTGSGYATRVSELSEESAPRTPFEPSQSFYDGDVMVSDWLGVKGKIKFTCQSNGTAIINMKLIGLLPNRPYTVWGLFDTGEEPPFDNFGPVIPLAGLPNVVLSNLQGVGEFHRVLNFCPMSLRDDEVPLKAVFVNFHSDVEVSGGVISLTGRDRYPGAVRHTQFFFPVAE